MAERDNELMGNISINEYQEVAEGYSVYDSTAEFLAQWAKDNAKENATIQAESTEKVAKICKVKVCKNGNLFIGTYDEDNTQYVNFFVSPAVALQLVNSPIVQPVYTTTPKGRKIRTGWAWAEDKVLQDVFKDLNIVYAGKDILEVF